jgi:photosystem II stability/assembly factor-like uncharacterized protein
MLRRAVALVCLLAGLLLGVAPPLAASGATRPATSAPAAPALVGSWMNGSVSLIAYENLATGEVTPGNSAGELYTVSAGGHYTRVNMRQSTLYSCTDLIASESEGTMTADEARMVLAPATNIEIGRFSCQPKSDYTRRLPLTRQIYSWKLDVYQRGTKLCLLQQVAKAKPDCLWLESKLPAKATTVSTGSGPAAWGSRASRTGDNLFGVSCGSGGNCLAAGYKFDVVSERGEWPLVTTTDGGATWSSRVYPQGQDEPGLLPVNGVSCPAASRCVLVGGQTTWTTEQGGGGLALDDLSVGNADFNGVGCAGKSLCVAVGEEGEIVTSPDGGVSWAGRASGTQEALYAVACPTSSLCVAVGDGGTIVTSTDGGITWASRTSGTDAILYGVACPSPSTCLAVGSELFTGGVVLARTDGGTSWSERSLPPGTDPLLAITCPTTTTCLAVGSGGTVLASTDAGASWAGRTSGTDSDLHAATCPSSSLCVAVGGDLLDATILLGKNGGSTWTSYTSGFDDILSGDNSPAGTIAAMQLDCAIGGSDCSGEVLRSVSCPSTSFCAAVGDQGTVLTTAGAGATWTSQVAAGGSSTKQLTSVSCASSRTCVAVGQGGEILRMS